MTKRIETGAPRLRHAPIEQNDYYAIRRSIAHGEATGVDGLSAQVAAMHDVSVSTVNEVRRASTWPKYLQRKNARTAERRAKPVEKQYFPKQRAVKTLTARYSTQHIKGATELMREQRVAALERSINSERRSNRTFRRTATAVFYVFVLLFVIIAVTLSRAGMLGVGR